MSTDTDKTKQEELIKAFGGCTKCYGKGYATWRHGETYRGHTHNMRNDIKFCDCERGKQLEKLIHDYGIEQRIDEVWYSAEQFEASPEYAERRIADLKKQLGKESE